MHPEVALPELPLENIVLTKPPIPSVAVFWDPASAGTRLSLTSYGKGS